MKKKIMLQLIALALMVTACQPQAPEVVQLSEEDVASIKQGSRTYVTTTLARDYNAWIELFTEDAVIMPPNTTILEGREAIRADAEAYPPFTSFTITPLEIDGLGDLAFARGTFSYTWAPEDADPITESGKYIEIWRKQTDGSWRLIRDIWNSDQPLP
jgi:uncharacterized protein (TIGR02246 family)